MLPVIESTSRAPEGIFELLRSQPCSALVINTTVTEERRKEILVRAREQSPEVPIIHIYDSPDAQQDPYADVDVAEGDLRG